MKDKPSKIHRFATFVLDVEERRLLDDGKEIPLTPKTFDVLVHLVEHAGHLVLKDDLLRAVWPDSFVEEINVPRAVHHLRKVLGQDNNGRRFIETVPTKGYRFTMPVVIGTSDDKVLARADQSTADLQASADGSPAETDKPGIARHQAARPLEPGLPGRPILVTGLLSIFLALGSYWYGGTPLSIAGTKGQSPPTNSSGAYQLYLEGKFLLDRRHADDFRAALSKFEEALRLDPGFALAYAGKADAEWRGFTRPTRSHDDIARARNSVRSALELDPDNSYAHTLQCRIYATYDWNFAAAGKACRRAVEADPNSPDAHQELAMFLSQFGRHEEALAEIDTSIALAPTSHNKQQRALILFYSKRYSEGIEELKEIEASDADYPKWINWYWWFYAMNGETEKALEAYLAGHSESESELRSIYSNDGWKGVQRAIVEKYKHGDTRAFHAAALHCQLGNVDRSFEFLENELKNRALWMIHLRSDPRFDPCREDPRFESVLRRVGLI